MISAADFVLFVHLSAHLLIPGNILISLLSTAVQGELLAFGTPGAVVFVRVPGSTSRNHSPGTSAFRFDAQALASSCQVFSAVLGAVTGVRSSMIL